ncbi:MAG TPA: ABC transporter permease [Gaiella sp.]|nr:ABC transporter permease [Gaiella sp.]
MSEGSVRAPEPDPGPGGEEAPEAAGFVERYSLAQQASGLLAPVLTAIIAFLLGGLVIVISTGKAPWGVYREIFKGAGFDWFFPWVDQATRDSAAFNLQQTLITTTALILTGLAVAFAFRCGLFNIGGQGQYLSGAIVAVIIGWQFSGMTPFLHVTLTLVLGTLAGALLAGIAGFLKATRGTHEVISTIMLNWIVIWIGVFLFTLEGPLQNVSTGSPISHDVADGAKLPVFWGDPLLQGLHIGFFIAIGALVLYWMILNRTTLGYGVRAVGFNPEASRYGGINVARNYFLAMFIAGSFAGIAGAIDILGWQYRISTGDILISNLGFVGIAVALLGRNSAVGVFLGALLFGALLTGTSTRNLDPETFPPELASNLTVIIQGMIVLFVGADIVVLWLLRKLRLSRSAVT